MLRRKMIHPMFIFLLFFLVGSQVHSENDFVLGLPANCLIGKSCWLVNLVDLDNSDAVMDYTCKSQTYNGHKGTDIGIQDYHKMKTGVEVLASAKGIVRAVRDGEGDWDMNSPRPMTFLGKECGNGVVLSHVGGWETQYCHLKKGSLLVKRGEKVHQGTKLGLIGLSGKTEFPHVHFSVRRWGKIIDPFVGEKRERSCGVGLNPLWDSDQLGSLTKSLTRVFNFGFSGERPSISKVRKGEYRSSIFSKTERALVLWAEIFRPNKGDQLHLKIFGPSREVVFEETFLIKKPQAILMKFGGRILRKPSWPIGRYLGRISLTYRNSSGKFKQQIVTKHITVK